MDYVYICRSGENEELRYSIRSLVNNLEDVENIWLIGGKPSWYTGNYFNLPGKKSKFDNIVDAIRKIPEIEEISEDFVLMDDDIFIVKKLESIPVYHGGLLSDKIKHRQSSIGRVDTYGRLLNKTMKDLNLQGIKDPIVYDLHVPMTMNKTILKNVMNKGYFPKTTYGNLAKVGGTKIKDVKVYNRNKEMSYDYVNGDLPFISTLDQSFERVYQDILKEMFIKPSSYELNS